MATDDCGWISEEEEATVAPVSRQWTRGRGGRGGGRGRGRDRGPANATMRVDTSKVGRVIGRGGASIRQLRERSGAELAVLEPDRYGNTDIALWGSPAATDCAKTLIAELVEDRPRREPSPPPSPPPPPTVRRPNPFEKEPDADGYIPIDWDKLNESKRLWEIERDARLAPLVKNIYREDPAVTNMTPSEAQRWRSDNMNISVKGIDEDAPLTDIPNPVTTFDQCFSAYPDIMREIEKQKFDIPSPIQSQAWPILMQGRDMIGIAQTGTGKTLAFLLPALIHIDVQPTPRSERVGPNVLVMAPTRELALQIEKEVNKYQYRGIRAVTVCGGKSRKDQIEVVGKGVEIVIATPGRLNDLIDAQHLDIEAITYLVLDEADRMLDMGFEPQIRRALIGVRPDRQTVMTSATWPPGVRRLANSFLTNPLQVVVGSLDLTAVHTVKQEILVVQEEEKYPLVAKFLLSIADGEKAIVFCSKRATATWLSAELAVRHYDKLRLQSIYGGLEQCDREQAVEDMQTNACNILIATDVASRGLDIDNVTHVVNFDFPTNIEEYVHRIGRTGRAGKSGTSISYVTKQDWSKAAELIKILEEAKQEVPRELTEMSARFSKMLLNRDDKNGHRGGRGGGGYRRGGRDRW